MISTVVGPLRAYDVSVRGSNESGLVDVSQTGGHVVLYQSDRNAARATWDEEKAKRRAETFLDRVGFHGFQIIYSLHNGNSLIVQAVPRISGALIYPDMVKLSIGLDNGEVLAFDARSYFTNHHTRHLAPPKRTVAQARAQLNHQLQLGRSRLVVVTTSDQAHEVLAYETEVSKDGETYLVYNHADNGQEVKVLRLIDVGGGQLTR
ncbi:MAG: germination protein YpeB [Firmicutes bacterium]|nr:germination protein YpeB [Bacillota bacterium]